jgi:hypothetical protein
MGPRGVLTKKNVVMITWTLVMQKCGLSISLQQLKMKSVDLTQTRVTPFQDGIPTIVSGTSSSTNIQKLTYGR